MVEEAVTKVPEKAPLTEIEIAIAAKRDLLQAMIDDAEKNHAQLQQQFLQAEADLNALGGAKQFYERAVIPDLKKRLAELQKPKKHKSKKKDVK